MKNKWTTTAGGVRVDGPPKTVKSRRQVFLDPATVDALRAHRARQNEERLAAGPAWDTDCKYVFTDELGGRFDPETFSKLFRRHTAAGPDSLRFVSMICVTRTRRWR